uniref:Uncharacterized protein n=1 Tax=Anopheles culicifacies TaxID=139723 RepID=A0A182MLY2_9DIPT
MLRKWRCNQRWKPFVIDCLAIGFLALGAEAFATLSAAWSTSNRAAIVLAGRKKHGKTNCTVKREHDEPASSGQELPDSPRVTPVELFLFLCTTPFPFSPTHPFGVTTTVAVPRCNSNTKCALLHCLLCSPNCEYASAPSPTTL